MGAVFKDFGMHIPHTLFGSSRDGPLRNQYQNGEKDSHFEFHRRDIYGSHDCFDFSFFLPVDFLCFPLFAMRFFLFAESVSPLSLQSHLSLIGLGRSPKEGHDTSGNNSPPVDNLWAN
ncbi:hypothetical protein V2G26_016274 [Clonostachys chloroleuca]